MPIIKANGGSIYYEQFGGGHATPLVFVNALGATTDMWREQLGLLSRGFRCIAYDANGHGRSPFTPKEATIDVLAGDLLGVLDALSLSRVHLIGASIGAMTAIKFAASHSGRIGKLVLIGATAKMPDPKLWTDRAAEARQAGLSEIAEAAMQRWFRPDFAAAHSGRVADIRDRFVAVDREAYARCCEAIGSMDLSEDLGRIRVKTLVVAGGNDAGAPPAVGESIRSVIGEGTLLVLPGAAHMVAIERPRELASWLSNFFSQP
jgi:3-oxoadipate enol-lactonase/4-carboxymuconolactone decarboxylase